MGDVSFSSQIPTIRESSSIQSSKGNVKLPAQEENNVKDNTAINTEDTASFQNTKTSSYDPEKSPVKFADKTQEAQEVEKENKPERRNMIAPLLVFLAAFLGNAPESLQAAINQNKENAEFISRHGASYDLNILGGAEAKIDSSQRFKEMSEEQKAVKP